MLSKSHLLFLICMFSHVKLAFHPLFLLPQHLSQHLFERMRELLAMKWISLQNRFKLLESQRNTYSARLKKRVREVKKHELHKDLTSFLGVRRRREDVETSSDKCLSRRRFLQRIFPFVLLIFSLTFSMGYSAMLCLAIPSSVMN